MEEGGGVMTRFFSRLDDAGRHTSGHRMRAPPPQAMREVQQRLEVQLQDSEARCQALSQVTPSL